MNALVGWVLAHEGWLLLAAAVLGLFAALVGRRVRRHRR